jgi:YD repeat-containing protein
VYNSKTVSDAVVQFAGTLHPVIGNKPTSVSVVFSFEGQSAQTYWWSVDSGANINDDVLFRVPVLSDPLATGGYAWSVDVTYHFGGNTYSPAGSTDYSGVYSHVDRSASEFGKGWYLEDLHELKLVNPKTNGGRVYLITGHGEPTRFDYNGTVYTREAGDQFFYTLTRSDGTDTYYTLTDKWGMELKFKDTGTTNTSAKLESIFDASGNETRYTYTSGILSSIQYMPTGHTTSFTYSGGYLTTITETVGSNSRAASVSITSGQLGSIALPDSDTTGPLAAPVWAFHYSGTTGRITKTIDPVGGTSEFTYGTGGANETIATIKQGADTSYLTPYNNATLGGTQGSPGSLLAVEDTFGQFTDERGKITKFEANALGHITKITDDDGNVTKFERDETEGWIEKITTPDPDGPSNPLTALEISYTYSDDGRGNRESETKRAAGTSTVMAQQTWEYGDADYSLPTKHIDELGRVTKYTIGPKSGAANNRGKILTIAEIVGVEDNGTNGYTDDAKTTYTYTTVASHVGLLDTIADPLGRITKHEYWTTNPHEGLLKKVTRNHGAQLTNNVQYEYDDFRNRDAMIDELGRRTEFLFDKLDRMTTRTDADPDAGGSQLSPVSKLAYDSAGNLAYTTDPLGNKTFFDYDNRGRQTQVLYPVAIGTPSESKQDDGDANSVFYGPTWGHDTTQGHDGDFHY